MEDKRLDFNAPLLSVRRFAAAPPPAQASSSSSATSSAAANSRAGVSGGAGAAGERPRWSLLPFYKAELKSGPVSNPGVVPFVWEQSPGRPKGAAFTGDSAAEPAHPPPPAAPKLPPGRLSRRPPEGKGEPASTDAISSASNGGGGAAPRRYSPISSAASTLTTTTTATTVTTSTTSSSSKKGTLSKTQASSREDPKGKAKLAPAAESLVSKERRGSCEEEDKDDDDDAAFSDALDTLSRTESCFMNCSVSGMTGGMEAWEQSGSFATDPQVRDFMMGRFLPAAQAVATASPQCGLRKAPLPSRETPRRVLGNGGELCHVAAPLPYQHRPNHDYSYPRLNHGPIVGNGGGGGGNDNDDDDDDNSGYDHLQVKGCGLLPRFCLKSSFCLMNPVPGMKPRRRMPLPASARRLSPQLRTPGHGSVGDAEDEHSWEEVYRYKMGRAHQQLREEGSKPTTESNQVSYWSDSQTPDGSSPHRRSNVGGISPYRNDMPPSPFHEGKGFLGVPKRGNRSGQENYVVLESCATDKDGEQYWEVTSDLNGEQASHCSSPVIEKTVYVDSVQVRGGPDSKPCSMDAKDVTDCTDNNSEIGGKTQRIETSPSLGTCEDNVLQGVSETAVDNAVDSRQDGVLDGSQPLKADEQGKNDIKVLESLLPPPLPKSPSESWLWRTLPSISSKSSTPQSFLGFQFHPKKQASQASSTDPRWETMVKTSSLSKGHVRFADVLVKSANVD